MSIQNIPYLENGMFLQDFPQKHSTSLIWKIECFAGFSPKHSITNIPFKFHVHAGFHLIILARVQSDRMFFTLLHCVELIFYLKRFFMNVLSFLVRPMKILLFLTFMLFEHRFLHLFCNFLDGIKKEKQACRAGRV